MPLPSLWDETFRLEWWVGGEHYDMLSRETSDGFAFLCEHCGYDKPWGAKFFPNRALIKFYSACAAHPATRGEIPGSMILWFHDELERMPDALIQREYAVHLAYYDKEKDHERDTFKEAA